MVRLDNALWREMLAYLRRNHPAICRQWFESELQPISLESGLLKIMTHSPVQRNYLNRKCLEQFREAAQAATGALITVRFVCPDEEPAASPSSAPAAAGSVGPHHGTSNASWSSPTAWSVARSGAPSSPGWSAEELFEPPLISPDYTFETFITGPGNQLAYAAALAVANQPGTAYNPLFIHGGVGLGKTHLLQAICQRIMHTRPDLKICYLSCDTFNNHFLECVQHGAMDQFRHRYRHVDVLIIDDIHFLSNRERTQEEFFHTFNELHQARKQIVLSSDAAPAEIPQLEQRLVSRFQWGLVAHITKPEYETRLAIVRSKAQLRGLHLPDDVVAYIATRIDSNARELEGAINTIQAMANLPEYQGRPIDLAMAKQALGDTSRGNGQLTIQDIVDQVASFFSVKLVDLQSKRRHKSVTIPRQVCMWLARHHTRFSLQEIGTYFGGRDHTTVMHSIEAVERRARVDPAFAQQIQQLDQYFRNRNS